MGVCVLWECVYCGSVCTVVMCVLCYCGNACTVGVLRCILAAVSPNWIRVGGWYKRCS